MLDAVIENIFSASGWENEFSQASERLCVLVVDDEDMIRKLNAAGLANYGFDVVTASDGAEAWEMLHQRGFDLLVTDNNMPDVTGFELLQKIHAEGLALPVIMATGTAPEEVFTRAPWLRPAAVLEKPYSIEDLLGTVKEVLNANAAEPLEVAPPPNWLSTLAPVAVRC